MWLSSYFLMIDDDLKGWGGGYDDGGRGGDT